MKSRIPMLWLAFLTIYQCYATTDALSTLKTVAANQEYTLHYMAKAAKILKKIRKPNAIETTADASSAVYESEGPTVTLSAQ